MTAETSHGQGTTEPGEKPWQDVPVEHEPAWQAIFLASREGLNLSAPCPVCGVAALHQWYHLWQREDTEAGGSRFIGRGGLWEWCSACRSFAHYSARVPEWWASDLQVDPGQLEHQPAAIEQAWREREVAPEQINTNP